MSAAAVPLTRSSASATTAAWSDDRGVEPVVHTARVCEHRVQLVAQLEIVAARAVDEVAALGLRQLLRLVEQRLDAMPAPGVHGRRRYRNGESEREAHGPTAQCRLGPPGSGPGRARNSRR
jgi:hypothetical protein